MPQDTVIPTENQIDQSSVLILVKEFELACNLAPQLDIAQTRRLLESFQQSIQNYLLGMEGV